MAKRKKKSGSKKASSKGAKASKGQNLYLLAIVSIVAIVGVVVLVLNAGGSSLELSDEDLSGEAYKLGVKAGLAESVSTFGTGKVYLESSSSSLSASNQDVCDSCDSSQNCYCDSDNKCSCK
jgi:hypothetical protein